MNSKSRILRAFGAFALVMWMGVAAHAEATSQFNIPAQPLADSLRALGSQTNINVLYDAALVAGYQAPALSSKMSADEALTMLLAGTGLSHKFVNEHTVVLSAVKSSRESSAPVSSLQMGEQGTIQVAQADTAPTSTETSAKPEAASSDAELKEIVVTAQKRQERLQDVPISIAVLSGEELDKTTAPNVTEMLGRVPGVSLSPVFAGGTTVVTVRGVGTVDPLFHGASTTAYYLDSVPFGFSKSALVPDADAYDLERVEALRGPQGTLFGASALNGVVRVLTKDANLDALEFKARGSSSSTEDGGWNYRGDAAVNVPLIEGKLAARAVVGYQDWSGWIDRPHRDNANDSQQSNVRLKINAQPTDALSIGLSAWRSRFDSNAPNTAEEPTSTATAFDEPAFSDYDAYGLKVGYEFGAFSLTSSTSYLDYKHYNAGDLSPIGIPGVADIYTFSAQTFAEELILTSTNKGPWRWTLGGMYRDSADRIREELPGFGLPAPSQEKNASESYAVFGELTRLFMDDKLELTAGVRYFEDDVTQTEESFFDARPPDQLGTSDANFDKLTKRLVLTWHQSEQATFYTSYGEGFRSGAHQYNVIKLQDANFPTTQPDTLKNYEVGAKTSVLGGRLAFDTALYYIDWQDAQRSQPVEILGVCCQAALINTGPVTGVGIDMGVTARPIDALQLSASVSWNDLSHDETTTILFGGVPVTLQAKGDRPVHAPEYTAAASADYTFSLGGDYEGQFSASANYTSESISRFLGSEFISDTMLIARTGFSILAPQRWTATLFVDNINNEDGSPVIIGQPEWNMRVRPRTVGVQFEYNFGD